MEMHDLYVVAVGAAAKSPAERKSRELTQAIVRYVHSRLAILGKLGVGVRVRVVKNRSLSSPQVIEAMRQKGITSLPALVTPSMTFPGAETIRDVYEKNIERYAQYVQQQPQTTRSDDDDPLAAFYREEMSESKTAEDIVEDEPGIGDDEGVTGMMDSFRRMVETRGGGSSGAPPGGANRRTDRIASPQSLEGANENGNSTTPSFAGGGAMDLEDDTTADDIMMNAFMDNQEDSMASENSPY
jgi:hypothetical protein